MIEDVRLALNGSRPVEFLSRVGGNVPSHEEVLAFVRELARRGELSRQRELEKRSGWQMSSESIAEYEVAHGRAKVLLRAL